MGTQYNKPPVGPAWGETAGPGNIVTPDPAFVAAGWPLSGTPPSRQRFNWALNWCANAIRYIMQRGLPDYDAAETYRTGSIILGSDNAAYKSLADGNVGNDPTTSPASWVRWGLTIADVNAATLTQATANTGDNTTRVSTTQFVQNAINQLNLNLTNYINNSIATLNGTLSGAITNVQNNLTAAIADYNAKINAAIQTATNAAVAAITPGFGISLGASGYIKFPNWASGFTLCWLTVSMPAGQATQNWSRPFDHSCLFVVTSCISGAGDVTTGYNVQGYNQTSITATPNRRTDSSMEAATMLALGIGY